MWLEIYKYRELRRRTWLRNLGWNDCIWMTKVIDSRPKSAKMRKMRGLNYENNGGMGLKVMVKVKEDWKLWK